ncbi:M4 family metallopeptidase [Bacillus safensis]|uniref:M4 family metallopeptidase n=1 Tax=Bacillus safensis TaxID=561879 RepID=UPI0030002669
MSEQHDNRDGFIPQYLLEKLAERGNEDAKRTLAQSKDIEKHNEELKKNSESRQLIENIGGQGKRFIYDSENTEQFKRKLVRKEGDSPVQDEIVNVAYDHCGKTLEYLKTKLGHNSIDNQGMDVICNVHFDKNYANAFWTMNQLSLGNGDNRTFINLSHSIDVVAHEIAHGVTEYVNELKYQFQSGALNEHFSDVVGSAVQQFVKGQTAKTADWLIGDEVVGPNWPGKALRSMKEPGTAHELDDQPSHMRDFKKLPIVIDRGGVHINSGIPNKAFYLTAMEIGTDQAAFLWINAWKNKSIIHPEATFAEAFTAIQEAAEQLVQQGKLPQQATAVVKHAFQEVGVPSLGIV